MSEAEPAKASADTPAEDAPALPERIGDYAVERLLGEGGMGRVYLCRDEALERPVAVKVLHEHVAAEKDMTERFLREARAMAKVSSPHVVTVFHVVQKDGVPPHIVMEVLEGEDVASRLRREGALPWPEAVDIALGAVKGLSAAHRVGIVHRDVKPANLFLTPHGTKLTDFGLARPIDGSADLTSAGIIVGTPHYLAPELARGGSGDVSSDIYALGATLFRMLTGKPPFDDEAALAVITKHILEPPPLVSSLGVSVPKALEDLVARMLAKDPRERPGNYDELEETLLALKRGTPEMTTASSPSSPANATHGNQPTGAVAPDAPTMVRSSRAPTAVDATVLTPRHALAPALQETVRDTVRVAWESPRGKAALLAAPALLLVVLAFSLGGRSDLERIDGGEAASVLAEIEREHAASRSGKRELVRGHALAKLERDTDAVAAYTEAAKKGASDERALAFLLSLLDDAKVQDVIEALRHWPDDDVEARLRELLKNGSWYERNHAASALKARERLTREEEEALAIWALLEGQSCERRRHGLNRLRRVGKGKEAHAAVQRASKRMPENLCMALEFPAALRELKGEP